MITTEETIEEKKVFKLTLDELNQAYEEAKRLGEASQKDRVKAVVGRDPLTIQNLNLLYKNQEEPFLIAFTLDFMFDYSIGTRGRWIVDTSVNEIEVIDIEEN